MDIWRVVKSEISFDTGPWRSLIIFSGVRYQIFGGESLYVLGCTFFKKTEIHENLQLTLLKKTLSSSIIPANVTNSTKKNC